MMPTILQIILNNLNELIILLAPKFYSWYVHIILPLQRKI